MTMSPELQQDYDLLQNEVGALGYRLREYTAVFAPTHERVNLLNSVAHVFFRMLSESLWADMLMHLGRLTDPATQGGFENLSLQRLPAIVADQCKSEVQAAVAAAVQAAQFARDRRNKVYAHRDLIVVRDPMNAKFTLGSVDQMREAIERCEAALDAVALYYDANRGTYFRDVRNGIAEQMMQTLEAGHKAQYATMTAEVQQMLDTQPAANGDA